MKIMKWTSKVKKSKRKKKKEKKKEKKNQTNLKTHFFPLSAGGTRVQFENED